MTTTVTKLLLTSASALFLLSQQAGAVIDSLKLDEKGDAPHLRIQLQGSLVAPPASDLPKKTEPTTARASSQQTEEPGLQVSAFLVKKVPGGEPSATSTAPGPNDGAPPPATSLPFVAPEDPTDQSAGAPPPRPLSNEEKVAREVGRVARQVENVVRSIRKVFKSPK